MARKAGGTNRADDGTGAANLTLAVSIDLYEARRFLGSKTQEQLGLKIPFDVYYKDPLVAKNNPGLEIDEKFYVPWEPRISDGPTSARFAVVDYDSTANKLAEPARWDKKKKAFFDPKGRKVDQNIKNTPQFRQVSTWAMLQNTLDFFECPQGLGRRILWGFEGNRLIVVPHAGVAENAYYDRQSKSLQFYYFDGEAEGERIYTCLSSDIVNHEFGHALLDGIRPYYLEALSPETAAFHEFLGDLTAILMTLRNASFRKVLSEKTGGDLTKNNDLANLAAQFGKAVEGHDYLRTASNKETMEKLAGEFRPHTLSQVLTGAVFDIVAALAGQYIARGNTEGKNISVLDALAYTNQRIQEIAIQALDLLPPVEVTFKDYAKAVLRNLELSDPLDQNKYRKMIFNIFAKRKILTKADEKELMAPHDLLERAPGEVSHHVGTISRSRAEAYRYLDDNRNDLFIPENADIVVAEVFTAEKMAGAGRRQPKQIILQYLWREEIALEDQRFGAFSGKTASLLCGATLVLDENGSMLAWSRKPGSEPTATALRAMEKDPNKLFKTEQVALDEMKAGKARRKDYLNALARRIEQGMIGEELGGAMGLLSRVTPPLIARELDGSVRFELSPHFHIGDDDAEAQMGGRQWQISS